MLPNEELRLAAIAWAVRTSDPAFTDWDGFTAWLEDHPSHSELYDAAMYGVDEAVLSLNGSGQGLTASQEGHTSTPEPGLPPAHVPAPANDTAPAPPARRWWPAAIAASLALVVGFSLWPGADTTYVVETQFGETGMIALEDGSQIDIAGGSRLRLDRDNPRFASLEQGQALFHVVHDDANPFLVVAGDDKLLDAGTVFDVSLTDSGLVVGVSEGLVIFNPDDHKVEIAPGEMLTRKKGQEDITTGTIALEQVGEWREGRLTFQNASVATVAHDLSRITGLEFAAAPQAASAGNLSGSILVDPVKADPASLGPLLGVSVRRVGDQWLINAP